MFRVLFLKELRETWWIGLLALVPMLYAVATEVDFGSRPGGRGYAFLRYTETYEIHLPPLINGNYAKTTLLWGCVLGVILGLWQTFRETQSRTWHFLLYRPVNRNVILRAKMSAAASLFGIAILFPAVAVMLWAATPRSHASPFSWAVTVPIWYALAACPVAYFAALFAGLRRSHPIGSRWWPLIGVVLIFGLLPTSLPHSMAVWIWGLLLLWTGLLWSSVRDELQLADFS